jgi:hypothetical protein
VSTSVSDPDATAPRPVARGGRQTTSRTLKGFAIITAIVAVLVVSWLVIVTQGNISGSEFAPTHFEQREFSFYEIPLLHLQITPIQRTAIHSDAASFLRQQSLVGVPATPPTVWHLVSLNCGLGEPAGGDAKLLIDPLEMSDQGASFWKQWSIDHPRSAAILWPRIQSLAERELYIFVPSLLEIAQANPDPSDLQAEFDTFLIQEYQKLIADMVAADRHELAQQLIDEAALDFPAAVDWPSLLAGPKP